MDGMLSQDEINALLSGMSDDTSNDEALDNARALNDIEGDAIGEISNISMGTAATTLYSLVNRKVTISTPVVSIANWDKLSESYDRPCVFIQISYTTGLNGRNILILKEKDVKIITDLMMGGDGTNTDGELGELHLSAIGEAMNQMMGSSATSLSSMINKKIDISTPKASLVDMNEIIDAEDIDSFLKEDFVKITFKMEIGDLVDSEIMQLYPIDFAKKLYESFASNMEEGEVEQVQQITQQPIEQSIQQPIQQSVQQSMQQPTQQPMQQPVQQQPIQPQPNMMYGQQNINVQPAQFQAFSNDVQFVPGQENIDLIMDVPLEVTVELGRTKKYIHEILDFAPGTIIELNKIAGEPIDVLVNGKLVAKGEVVVIDESFGVRVTEIIR